MSVDEIRSAPEAVVIAYQTNLDPEAQGGGVRYVLAHVAWLLDQGVHVTFFGAGALRGPVRTGLDYHRVCREDRPWPVFLLGLLVCLLRQRGSVHGLVHLHRSYFILPFLIAGMHSPRVCTLHGETLEALRHRHPALRFLALPWFRAVECFCLSRIDALVAVDAATAASFASRMMAFRSTRSPHVIPAPVCASSPPYRSEEPSPLEWPEDAEIVLFVGRISAIKQIPLLLEAFSGVRVRMPHACLSLLGDGEDLVQFRRSSEGERVRFHGPVAHGLVLQCMREARLVVLCSRSEASPTVVKEALSMGTPVVSTDVGDVLEVLSACPRSRVVRPTPEALADAICAVLEDPESVDSGGGRRVREAYSPDSVFTRIWQVYLDLPNRTTS